MAENVHKVFSEIGDEVSFYGLDEAHQIWRKVTAEEPSFGDGDRLGDSPEFPLWILDHYVGIIIYPTEDLWPQAIYMAFWSHRVGADN